MKNAFLRACSLILSLVLLVNMLPMSIFAEEYRKAVTEAEATDTSVEEAMYEDAYVVDELEEKRTEYSKEFLLSNGLHMAALYADPVHYETGSGWQEIDNTLKIVGADTLTNTAGLWNVSFPQQLSKDKSVTVEKDGYTLSFFMAGELTQAEQIELPVLPTAPIEAAAIEAAAVEEAASTAAEEKADLSEKEEALQLSQMVRAEAQILEVNRQELYADMTYEEMIPRKNISRLQYSAVYPGTDILYDLEGNKVKESVILESYRSDLRGYRYTLNVGQLHPVLQEDGSVLFYDAAEENVVMAMPAPYLVDGEQVYSYDIDVSLTGSDGSYTMTYLLPRQWLAAEERAWPVVLDPAVYANLNIDNIRDATVAERKSYSHTWGMNGCGNGSEAGVHRFYLKYDQLPKLETSDVILYADVSMYSDPNSAGTDTIVEAHKVNSVWNSETITWSNKPGYNSMVEDYAIVREHAKYVWTITDIVRDWYSGSNTGVMFKASDAIEAGSTVNCKQFWSSDYGIYANRPVLQIYFRNNNGVESYWDYTSATAGSAGTGYVNTYTGNLVWVHEDIGFSGNRMPVSISHVYNMNDLGHNDFAMGYGWRTGYHQRVYVYEENPYYYVWEDGDGTRHYFLYNNETGAYGDEDGLEMTLKVESTAYGSYSITDKSGNISYFDSKGRLVRMQNNQKTVSAVTVTYTNSTDSHIATITDGAGRVYVFDYTDGKLTQIRYTGKNGTTLSTVSFTYDGWRMTRITKPEGITADFGYDSTYYLMHVTDSNGYRIAYDYNTVTDTSYQPYRIIGIREYSGTTAGGALTLTYAHNQTKLTDHNGNVELRQFNDFGNVTCIQDDEGRAQFAQYAKSSSTDTGKSNQLTLNSKLQNTVANLVSDSSFEAANPWTARANTTMTRSTEEAYIGSYSLKMTGSGRNTGIYSTVFTVPPWETVTFSAYVKTSDSYSLMIQEQTATGGYENNYSEPITGSGQWERQEFSYKNASGRTVSMWAFLVPESTGTFYMDCVQVEISPSASRYNILENGDFTVTGSPAYHWTGHELSTTDKLVSTTATAAPYLSGSVLSITGDPTADKRLVNHVGCSGSAGDCYVVTGWAWADGAVPETSTKTLWGEQEAVKSTRDFSITVSLHHYDGTTSTATAKFNPDCASWQYTAAVVVAKADYHSIAVRVSYGNNANTVWFDGIQLFKEQFGASYTYDEDGNVVSVTDLQKQTTEYEYDTNNNLTKILQDNKAKMTYEYDAYHNVTKATSEEGLVYLFEYDDYGNNDSVSIANGSEQINSISHYTNDGNYLRDVWDPLNRETIYGYDTQTGELDWTQSPLDLAQENSEDYCTAYRYDGLGRVKKVIAYTGDVGPIVSYSYETDKLSSITTAGATYCFDYNGFGQQEAISIENQGILAAYEYSDDGNHDLTKLTYGNGDVVNYTYDDKGRPLSQQYVDTDTDVATDIVRYSYDNSGNLSTQTDSATDTTTRYFYDLTDRMMRYEEKRTDLFHSVGYEYDAKNNLTQLVEVLDEETFTTSYTYDDDNRVTGITQGTVSESYTYDAYGRVSQQQTKKNSTVVKTDAFTFEDLRSGEYTSSQVSGHRVTVGGTDVTYGYTYDQNGNITQITKGSEVVATYAYDTLNRLIREDIPGKWTRKWTYDTIGNIMSRTEYLYAAAGTQPNNELRSVSYDYYKSGWEDRLQKYTVTESGSDTPTEHAISYDNIGNPETYGGWSMKWTHGRRLARMAKQLGATPQEEESWNFTYNADGLRTKRTRTVNGTATTWEYVYNGSQLTRMITGDDTLYFAYDANGTPLTVTHKTEDSETTYYYVTNLQGDVLSIVNASGSVIADYAYDAWGNPIGDLPTSGIAALNPLRYRGYIYDTETGLYYVSSRYYDPEIGRFINADDIDYLGADGSPLSYNLFAYCMNNPVNRFDVNGNLSMPNWAKVAIGAVAIAGLAVATVCTGGAAGVIAGAALTGAISGGISGAVSGAVSGAIENGWQGALDGACTGFMTGTLIGGATGAATSGLSMATGAVKVVGSAQKTGTILHKAASNIEAGKMALNPIKYSKITLNRALNTAGLSGRRMPDVIGIARNGSSKLIEVVSKSQTVKQMTSKCISMVNANPGASYKVVGWAATISRLFS